MVSLDEKDWSEAPGTVRSCGLVAPSRLYGWIGKKSIATGAVKCHLIVDKRKIAEFVWQFKFNLFKSKISNSSKW
jgi:hypothetical protein